LLFEGVVAVHGVRNWIIEDCKGRGQRNPP